MPKCSFCPIALFAAVELVVAGQHSSLGNHADHKIHYGLEGMSCYSVEQDCSLYGPDIVASCSAGNFLAAVSRFEGNQLRKTLEVARWQRVGRMGCMRSHCFPVGSLGCSTLVVNFRLVAEDAGDKGCDCQRCSDFAESTDSSAQIALAGPAGSLFGVLRPEYAEAGLDTPLWRLEIAAAEIFACSKTLDLKGRHHFAGHWDESLPALVGKDWTDERLSI